MTPTQIDDMTETESETPAAPESPAAQATPSSLFSLFAPLMPQGRARKLIAAGLVAVAGLVGLAVLTGSGEREASASEDTPSFEELQRAENARWYRENTSPQAERCFANITNTIGLALDGDAGAFGFALNAFGGYNQAQIRLWLSRLRAISAVTGDPTPVFDEIMASCQRGHPVR